MAMNVGSSGGDDEVVSEINTTPLVDVMLVLLIIFLITIPVATTSIKVKLPSQSVEIRQSKPENIVISVNDKNVIHYYDRKVTYDELVTKLREAKEELFNLRFQAATGQLESHGRLTAVRKEIARIYTILRERELGIGGAA